MNQKSIAPEKPFRVEVDITTTPPTYTYYNRRGVNCDGSVSVTEANTAVSYSLINNTNNLIFAAPIIEAEDPSDLTILISNNQQTITFYDKDLTNESVCIKLVVVKPTVPTNPYVSLDPIMRNVPN
ncbi:MAG: DP-EP family protein [Paraglaciecola sp.]|uniref:DP-EP family protein n=1 Tax=Paraglaciecola sp. TaxID=1920173 RepID=UPI00273DFEC0|nr:DP-EP family protein [Paraglaciecola sp.]MDP5029626.1 DP-EP family protein [Paraglaciecola sp.]MDP5133244.1 DP-EP family protein [Paraglaciecola sp.]